MAPTSAGRSVLERACLRELLERPRLYYQRVEDTASLGGQSGLEWTRTIQLRLPEVVRGPNDQDLWLPVGTIVPVSLGMFRRRRLADLEVRDQRGHRVSLVPRPVHGSLLARNLLRRFLGAGPELAAATVSLVPDPVTGFVPGNRADALRALQDLTVRCCTAATPIEIDDERLSARAGVQLYNYYALSGFSDLSRPTPTVLEGEALATANIATLSQEIGRLAPATQYLCYVEIPAGRIVTLTARYSTGDPTRIGRRYAGEEDAGRFEPVKRWQAALGKVRLDIYARAMLVPSELRLYMPIAGHAASHYFMLGGPADSSIDAVWLVEADEDVETRQDVECGRLAFNVYNGVTAAAGTTQAGAASNPPDSSTSPHAGSHNGDALLRGLVDHAGTRVRAYISPSLPSSHSVLLAFAFSVAIAVLFGVGILRSDGTPIVSTAPARAPQWLGAVLAVTVVASVASMAQQGTHYFRLTFRTLTCFMWLFLAAVVTMWVSSLAHLGAGLPAPISWLFHDQIVLASVAGLGAWGMLWVVAIGGVVGWLRTRLQRHARRALPRDFDLGHFGRLGPERGGYLAATRHAADTIVVGATMVSAIVFLTVLLLGFVGQGLLAGSPTTTTRWTISAFAFALLAVGVSALYAVSLRSYVQRLRWYARLNAHPGKLPHDTAGG